MVVERLIGPLTAERRPYLLLFIGFFYALIAGGIAHSLFPDYATLVLVFFIVLPSVPLVYAILKLEEEKDTKIEHETALLKEHSKALCVFLFLFIGVTIGLSLLYLLLPQETATNLFSAQIDTIAGINGGTPSGHFMSKVQIFNLIFFNNMRVLSICILFSFFFGVGAIFIMVWNASVIATAIGMFAKERVLDHGLALAFSSGLGRYMFHGILEIGGYFIGGIAGAIISFAIIKHHYSTKKFGHILLDVSDLLLISIAVLFFAGLFEVYITPLLF